MTTAQQIVLAVLREKVTVPVVHKVPRPRPDLFIRVDQAAPRRTTPVTDVTTVIVQVSGPDLDTTVDLIDRVRDLCFDLPVLDDRVLGWSEDSGPVDFPDPELTDSTCRWQFVGTLTQALT